MASGAILTDFGVNEQQIMYFLYSLVQKGRGVDNTAINHDYEPADLASCNPTP
jgi:hypothetical protein